MEIDIQVPYTTQPKMVRNNGSLFNKVPNQFYLKQKQIELYSLGNDLWAETQEAKVNQLVQKSCRHLGLLEQNNIVDFALYFEEDVAIMHNGYLSAICFCFPSSWIPAERIGLRLAAIHGPVADNEKLIEVSDKLAKTMADPVLGSFQRTVWTITVNSELSNHPANKKNISPRSINDLYFRTEIQTTEPLGDGITSLFFVKVEVLPLTTVWAKLGNKIKASINSMSENILSYKNLSIIKPIINNVVLI